MKIINIMPRSRFGSPPLVVMLCLSIHFGSYSSVRSISVGPSMDVPTIKRIVRLAQDRDKMAKRRKISPLELSPWCLTTALCIVAATQGDFAAAVEWLYSTNRRGRPLEAGVSQETTRDELKRLFEAKPPDEVAQWANPQTSLSLIHI